MNVFKKNLTTNTDSYKVSHPGTFPKGATHSSYYIEARTENEDIVPAGMNRLARIIDAGITKEDVERSNRLFKLHFGRDIFKYEAWMRIVDEMNGKLPINLLAVPEGHVMKSKNVIAVIENTHPEYVWLPGNCETFALRAIWYPTSVATKSMLCKRVLKNYLEMTSDLEGADFNGVLNTRLHDFGARGATCDDQAAIGGLAHLYNFVGTDTVEALILAQDLFAEECAGFSIPAREHSTTICWENEDDAYRNSINLFGEGFYSCVMDSTDYEAAVERVCLDMKDDIINAGGTFVFRPDSGDMIRNIMFTLQMLGKHFGYTRNSKGYKVLNKHVRIIQGDDINSADDILRVLSWMESKKWAAENIAFGMGGGLLQKVNRDTHKFAMKMSAIKINGVWRGVAKCPKGAEWKASKKGMLDYVVDTNGNEYTIDMLETHNPVEHGEMISRKSLLNRYVVDGRVVKGALDTLQDIRIRVNLAV